MLRIWYGVRICIMMVKTHAAMFSNQVQIVSVKNGDSLLESVSIGVQILSKVCIVKFIPCFVSGRTCSGTVYVMNTHAAMFSNFIRFKLSLLCMKPVYLHLSAPECKFSRNCVLWSCSYNFLSGKPSSGTVYVLSR